MNPSSSRTIRVGRSEVVRFGYGAMRLAGPVVFGFPADRAGARKILRRAIELGVNFIDTADAYGPQANEQLIADALAPYRADLVIATKSGCVNGGPNTPPPWCSIGRPEYIFQQVELSLRNLQMDRLDLWQLHAVDPCVPIEETLGAAARLQEQGKIKDIGLSNVTLEHVERARKVVDIASVQNLYNIAYRDQEAVVEYCENRGIAFLPYFPMGGGLLAMPEKALARAAKRYDATVSQICLAWLLHRSSAILPIPGTAVLQHLEENMKAAELALTDEQWAEIEDAVAAARV
jgi:aryl-alcohol dehydrogenase-like predicted oxidoreductase